MPNVPIRDVSLSLEVIGHGQPMVLVHGGPGAVAGVARRRHPVAVAAVKTVHTFHWVPGDVAG